MNIYVVFVGYDAQPISIVASNKKTAHEYAQRLYPGEAVEIFEERELELTRAVKEAEVKVAKWMVLLRSIVDECFDRAIARKRIANARAELDKLDNHFAEVL